MAYISASSAGQITLPETFSQCVAEGVTVTHNFKMINFSLLEGIGIGKFVSSSTFSVGGCDWNIRIYPDGSTTEFSKGPFVSLCLQGGATGTRVKCSFALLDERNQLWRHWSTVHTFASIGEGWGCPNFIDRFRLRSLLLYLNNDCFTVRCVVTVIKDHPHTQNVVVPEPNLQRDYERMMRDGKGADVEIYVDGQLFRCHRCVLAARSPVFDAQLFGLMKNNCAKPIKIHDMKASIFEALLHFLYTDSLTDKHDNNDRNVVIMQHLLVAADRYGVDRLKSICEQELCHSIDMQSVATTLALAEQHQCMQLKDSCLRLIASPGVLGAIMQTDGFKHLVSSCPLVMKEIEDKIRARSGFSSLAGHSYS